MTTDPSFQRMLERNEADSHYATSSLLAPSDTAKSPDRSSQQNASATDASYSQSPNTSSFVLTPASTNPDFTISGDLSSFEQPDESDVISTSGGSHASPYSEDYVHIDRHFVGQSSFTMDANDLNQAIPRSEAHDVHTYPSSAPLDPLFPSMATNQFSIDNMAELSRHASTDYEQGAQFGNLIVTGNYSSSEEGFDRSSMAFEDELCSHPGNFGAAIGNSFGTRMDFSSQATQSFGSAFSTQSPFVNHMHPRPREQTSVVHPGAAQVASSGITQQAWSQALPGQWGHVNYQSAPDMMDRHYFSQQYPAAASFPPAQPPRANQDLIQSSSVNRYNVPAPRHSSELAEQSSPSKTHPRRQLKPAVSETHIPIDQAQKERRKPTGGRKKGERLPAQTRHESSKMRKISACWRCVMQRDKVSASSLAMHQSRILKPYSAPRACPVNDVSRTTLKASPCISHATAPNYQTWSLISCHVRALFPHFQFRTDIANSLDDMDASKTDHRGLCKGPSPSVGSSKLARCIPHMRLRTGVALEAVRIRATDQ